MDEKLRSLAQAYETHQDQLSLDALLDYMLRIQNFEAWEAELATSELAQKYYPELRRKLYAQVNKWVNVYEDFTARATIYCELYKDLAPTQLWCHNYYTKYPLFYQGDDVNPLGEEPFFDPPAKIKIRVSNEACFNFDPTLEPGERREINLWGQRERFVSFALVEMEDYQEAVESAKQREEAGEEEEEPKTVQLTPTESVTEILGSWPYHLLYQVQGLEPEDIAPQDPRYRELMTAMGYVKPHWVSVCHISRNLYGGPEEGGWNYDAEFPLACIYVGILPTDRSGFQVYIHDNYDFWPEHVKEAYAFLGTLYDSEEEEDIAVALGTEIPHETPRPRYE